MTISGKKIAEELRVHLKKEVKKLGKKSPLKLVVFLVGSAPDQLSFVKIKEKTARDLGIGFEFIHFKKVPGFEDFVRLVKEKSEDPKTTGIIIQQPLPNHLITDTIYNFIGREKDIEGNHIKTPFLPPLGLAALTVLKYAYSQKIDKKLFVDFSKDKLFFKKNFKNKKIVIIGRGITGGIPIGKTLTAFKMNFLGINSQTPNPELYYKEADIIISAVGRKVVNAENIKPGTILISAGLRKERGKLKGDYDEDEIKNIASFYTPTPGGLGPIDVTYLYKNLLDAAKLQR